MHLELIKKPAAKYLGNSFSVDASELQILLDRNLSLSIKIMNEAKDIIEVLSRDDLEDAQIYQQVTYNTDGDLTKYYVVTYK